MVETEADWLKATCKRLETMGFVVVGRNEWERMVPQFIDRFPARHHRSPNERPTEPKARLRWALANLERAEDELQWARIAAWRPSHKAVQGPECICTYDDWGMTFQHPECTQHSVPPKFRVR